MEADFTISVNYTGDAEYADAFTNAAATWQSLVTGYLDGVVANRSANSSYGIGDTIDTLFITANVAFIDGVGGILGSAGPDEVILDQSGFLMASDGGMNFDSADIANLASDGTLEDVILHEMGHVMGFGTLWQANNVYTNNSGEYTGAGATAFWQSEFGQVGTPDVELGGGAGTANGHWNEVDNGSGFTGITDPFGRDMRYELMTGWLNSDTQGTPFISNMTLASFADIGFTVNFQAIPEPSSAALLVVAGFVVCYRRRNAGSLC